MAHVHEERVKHYGEKIKVDDKELEVDAHYVMIDHGKTKEMAIELFDSNSDKDYQRFLDTVGFYLHNQTISYAQFQELNAQARTAYIQLNPKGLKLAVASPDQGGVERTRLFAETLGIAETVLVEKKRNLEIKHESEVVEVSGNVSGKTVIIPDDVIVSGGTIINAANAIMAKGAKRIILAATHADFISGTIDKLQNSSVEQVFVTDTIQLPQGSLIKKLQIISVAGLLAAALNKLKT